MKKPQAKTAEVSDTSKISADPKFKTKVINHLNLYKENFKFSSGHFLIFDDKHAEKLHGHNYRVDVRLGIPTHDHFSDTGFFVDFNVFKKFIKACVDEWDEHVLLPGNQPEMIMATEGPNLHVRFRERYYMFPANEVIILPVTNTSVEELSRLLAEKLINEFHSMGISEVEVTVEETAGQSASTKLITEAL